MVEAEADERGDGWRYPMPAEPDGWVGVSESDARWLRSKAVPQPVGTFSQPVAVRAEAVLERPSTYVLYTRNGTDETTLGLVRGMADERGSSTNSTRETGRWCRRPRA